LFVGPVGQQLVSTDDPGTGAAMTNTGLWESPPCPACGGTGERNGKDCTACGGTGIATDWK
jgi:DnaJ-class molecular chaperone